MYLALVAIVLATLIFVTWRTRDFFLGTLFLFGSISLAALILTISAKIFGLLPLAVAQMAIISSLTLMCIVFLVFKRTDKELGNFQLFLPALSAMLFVAILIAKTIGSIENEAIFSGVGRLAFAEDNAKWLNLSANIAQGNLLNLQDGTNGGLAVLIVISSAFATTYSYISVGGLNIPGITIETVLFAQSALLVSAPLALTPIAKSMYKLRGAGLDASDNQNHKKALIVGLVISSALLIAAVVGTTAYGHLSFTIILIQLLFWSSSVVYGWNFRIFWPLLTIIGSSVSLIWLPLPLVGAAIALFGLCISSMGYWGKRDFVQLISVIATLLNLIVVIWLALPEVGYIAAGSQASTSIHLVVAEGGAMAPKKPEMFIFLIAVVGCILFIRKIGHFWNFNHFVRLFPIAMFAIFTVAVLAYDFVLAPEGWPHYGSRKLSYGVLIIEIALLMPVAMLGYFKFSNKKYVFGWAATATVFMAFVFSNSFQMLQTGLYTVSAWTAHQTVDVEGNVVSNYWVEKITPLNAVQTDVSRYPIACVEVNEGEIIRGGIEAYSCTRFLISMHALEDSSSALMWLNSSNATKTIIKQLSNLPTEARTKPIFVLDKKNNSVKKIDFLQMLEIYSLPINR